MNDSGRTNVVCDDCGEESNVKLGHGWTCRHCGYRYQAAPRLVVKKRKKPWKDKGGRGPSGDDSER